MTIKEAVELLDKYFSAGISDESIAWEIVRAWMAECKKSYDDTKNVRNRDSNAD